eukprot:364387-Chlamydomonas_euryale.AAC.2
MPLCTVLPPVMQRLDKCSAGAAAAAVSGAQLRCAMQRPARSLGGAAPPCPFAGSAGVLVQGAQRLPVRSLGRACAGAGGTAPPCPFAGSAGVLVQGGAAPPCPFAGSAGVLVQGAQTPPHGAATVI